MEEFGRAGQLVERGPTHLSVRSRAERSVSHQTDGTETDRGPSWLCHASYISDTVARREETKLPNVGVSSAMEIKPPMRLRRIFKI